MDLAALTLVLVAALLTGLLSESFLRSRCATCISRTPFKKTRAGQTEAASRLDQRCFGISEMPSPVLLIGRPADPQLMHVLDVHLGFNRNARSRSR